MERIGLIPLVSEKSDIALLAEKEKEFKHLDENIARSFSDLLLMTMNILSKQFAEVRRSVHGDPTRQQKLVQIKQTARNLIVFAGMIQFRMPSDTYERLNRMDVFMN